MEETVKMIADDIFEKLHDIDKLYTLEELAEMCRYKDGNILDSIESESSGSPTLDIGFNLEDFLSVLFHFRPYVSENNKTKFNNTIQKILKLIKENTNYSYDSKVLKHGALLKFLSDLSGKNGNKFSIITTNYDVLIEDLFSYLFVQYFLKYNLSLKSDKNVLSMFSQLPTDIRFRTLQKLFEIKGYDNIQLIDKYLLAMVKSKGWEEAYFWLISHRKEIHSMGYPSENEIIEYTDDFDEDELSLPLRKFQNVFGLLSSVLRNPKVKSVSGGIYDTFEEAVKYFYEENLETYLSATREQIEFRELLYFCFIGRTQTN